MTPRAPSQERWLRRSAAFRDHWGRCRRVAPVRAARRLHAHGAPMSTPGTAIAGPSRTIIQTTVPRAAPSARRTPISRTRAVTEFLSCNTLRDVQRHRETNAPHIVSICAQNRQVLELFWEDSWRNVYAGELEVRPPGAPTIQSGNAGSEVCLDRCGEGRLQCRRLLPGPARIAQWLLVLLEVALDEPAHVRCVVRRAPSLASTIT